MDAEHTVGEVARTFGVTVRTLHHYDEIGLLSPSERTLAGYRRHTPQDLERLTVVVGYRRLGMPLADIAAIITDGADPVAHLTRQRAALADRIDELTELALAVDHTLETLMNRQSARPDDLRAIFGDSFDDSYAVEAQQRWGETDAWKQSARRTKSYTVTDWEKIKAEGDAINAAFTAALDAGLPADSPEAMDAAEAHRRHIETWFYDLDHAFHTGLADMYLADPRFTKTYEDIAPGLAAYVHDAIYANAIRA